MVVLTVPILLAIVGYVLWKTAGGEIHVEDALVVSEHPDGHAMNRGAQPTPIEMFHQHAEAVEKTVGQMVKAVNKAASGEDATEDMLANLLLKKS